MDWSDLSLPNSKRSNSDECVSIVLPTYKPNINHLTQSIQSVGEQTYEHIELIVVDSTGLDWLCRLSEEYSWIVYRYQSPTGLPSAWNEGIDVATGKFIGFLSDDDYYSEEKIATQVRYLNQGYDIAYADKYIIDEDGSMIPISAQYRRSRTTLH